MLPPARFVWFGVVLRVCWIECYEDRLSPERVAPRLNNIDHDHDHPSRLVVTTTHSLRVSVPSSLFVANFPETYHQHSHRQEGERWGWEWETLRDTLVLDLQTWSTKWKRGHWACHSIERMHSFHVTARLSSSDTLSPRVSNSQGHLSCNS